MSKSETSNPNKTRRRRRPNSNFRKGRRNNNNRNGGGNGGGGGRNKRRFNSDSRSDSLSTNSKSAQSRVEIPPLPEEKPDFGENNVFNLLMQEVGQAVQDSGYTIPTEVQEKCIPFVLEGRDVLGSAQTGTGKTAAFTLPLIQYLAQNSKSLMPKTPRVLIMAPTRELAAQIGKSIETYTKYLRTSYTVIFGGVGQSPQERAMRKGVDFLVATPGRLLDLMNQGYVDIRGVEAFVLDEADRMLDMGFIHDIRKVVAKLPRKRHSLFFSATLAPNIVTLANSMLYKPVKVTIAPDEPTVERISQRVMFVDSDKKDRLLVSVVGKTERVIVFTKMKHSANRVAAKLEAAGISAAAIHGNKSQSARTRALEGFKAGSLQVLVATDIAARGIDVRGVRLVVNYHLPTETETYVHRIGRTARAGNDGDAVSFCEARERAQLGDIERAIKKEIPVDEDHPFHSEKARQARGDAARPEPKGQNRNRNRGRRSGPPRRRRR